MKKPCLRFFPLLWLFLSGCLSSTPFQSARVVEPGRQSASVSVQKSIDATGEKDYAWYMMEFAGRFPVAKGRMDFSLGGAIMAFEDDDGLSGVGAMFGLGTKRAATSSGRKSESWFFRKETMSCSSGSPTRWKPRIFPRPATSKR